MTRTRRAGWGLLAAVLLVVAAAPWLAPHAPGEQLADHAYAPPTPVRVRDAEGWHRPFIRPQVLQDRLRRVFVEGDTRVPVGPHDGVIVQSRANDAPLLWLGADPLGRDVFARLLLGARWSLGVALFGALGALALGALIGSAAAVAGGATERWAMRLADAVLVLPAVYLVLALRSLLPPVLDAASIFGLMTLLFAVAAWPHVARGVRAIVAVELARGYVEAARAAGASRWRVIRHVLPATRGFLAAELVLLLPALLSAEAAISFVGLGFPEPTPSWGTMLQEAANVRVLTEAPWMLAPAGALFIVVLAVQLAGGGASTRAVFFDSLANHANDPT